MQNKRTPRGHIALKAWLKREGRKALWLADQLRADRSSVSQWLNGKRAPLPAFRHDIARVTLGEVPASAWDAAE